MILEPLVLVLIVDEVGQESPVTRGVTGALNHEIVALVAEVRHGLHAHDCVLYVDQFFEAEGVRGDWYFGVTDLKDTILGWTDELNRVAIFDPDTLLSLFYCGVFLIMLLDLWQDGG